MFCLYSNDIGSGEKLNDYNNYYYRNDYYDIGLNCNTNLGLEESMIID